jgi:phosphoenolpyruvate synthase/pyruvate phosphate dikinase
VPSVPGQFATLKDSLDRILTELDQLDVQKLFDHIDDLILTADRAVEDVNTAALHEQAKGLLVDTRDGPVLVDTGPGLEDYARPPAILRLIQSVVIAAHEAGIPVAMCGEMAGESMYIPILLGLGIDELSMNPIAILEAKKVLRSMQYTQCREIVDQLFGYSTAEDIRQFLIRQTKKYLQKNSLDNQDKIFNI